MSYQNSLRLNNKTRGNRTLSTFLTKQESVQLCVHVFTLTCFFLEEGRDNNTQGLISYTFTLKTTSSKGHQGERTSHTSVTIEFANKLRLHSSQGWPLLSEMLMKCEDRGNVWGSPERRRRGCGQSTSVCGCVDEDRTVCGVVVLGFSLLMGLSSPPYASSSKPMPTLCPPALKFFPSIRAERVTFTPAGTRDRESS